MRLSSATAASVALAAALLAGCSASYPGTSAVPSSTSGFTQPMGAHGQRNPFDPAAFRGKMTPLRLVKLQEAGKLAAPAKHKIMEQILKTIRTKERPQYRFHPNAAVGAWALNNNFSYMLGFKKNLKKEVTAVNVESDGCYSPVTVKVDSNEDANVACELNSSFNGSAAQSYSSSGVLKNTYAWSVSCPPSYDCEEAYGYGFDQGESSNYVFSGNTESEVEYCEEMYPYTCYFDEGAGFYYWPKGSPSASSTQINLYDIEDGGGNLIYEVGYFDVDKNNNIYFTYYGCEQAYPYNCGYGLDELANATNPSSTPTELLGPGSIELWGGIYVSNGGATLNIIDQDLRTNSQYALPWTGSLVTSLGPTPTNIFGYGDPIQGTFNSGGSAMAIGDAYGWLDKIRVTGDVNKAIPGLNCTDGCFGTSYSPSDRTW
jgi:hypothetical protein